MPYNNSGDFQNPNIDEYEEIPKIKILTKEEFEKKFSPEFLKKLEDSFIEINEILIKKSKEVSKAYGE